MKSYRIFFILVSCLINLTLNTPSHVSFNYFNQKINHSSPGVIQLPFYQVNTLFYAYGFDKKPKIIVMNEHDSQVILKNFEKSIKKNDNTINVEIVTNINPEEGIKLPKNKIFKVKLLEVGCDKTEKFNSKKIEMLEHLTNTRYWINTERLEGVYAYETYTKNSFENNIGILKESITNSKNIIKSLEDWTTHKYTKRLFLYKTIYNMIVSVYHLHYYANKAHYDIKPSNFVYVDDRLILINVDRTTGQYYYEESVFYLPGNEFNFYISKLRETEIEKKKDVYSLGVSIWELIASYLHSQWMVDRKTNFSSNKEYYVDCLLDYDHETKCDDKLKKDSARNVAMKSLEDVLDEDKRQLDKVLLKTILQWSIYSYNAYNLVELIEEFVAGIKEIVKNDDEVDYIFE